MIFNFRKIASAAASIAMVGSTVALAAAANFPAPFVTGDDHDVALVWGSTATSTDLTAAVDIAATLQTELGTGGTGPATITGESYPLFGSGDSQIYANTTINSQRTTATDTDLPNVLADSDFSGNVDADLTHIIKMGSFPRFVYSQQPTSEDDPTWNIELSTNAANSIYNATVTFDQAAALNHSDSEGETFTMFGQEFTIGSATDTSNLILFRAADTLFLDSSSNPSSTVTVDSETYTVELVSASDTSATIRVTNSAGESDQKEINEAASKKILGVEVAVNTADESDALGTISAEVVIGTSRLEMSSGSEVLFGTDEDAIEGTRVTFTTNLGSLTQIDFQATADDIDEDAILPNEEFIDPILGSFKIVFTQVAGDDEREAFDIHNSGDDKMTVKLTNHEGHEKTVNFVYNSSTIGNPDATFSSAAKLGDSSGRIYNIREQAIVNRTYYTVLGNEDEGYLLQVNGITNASSGFESDSVRLDDAFSDESYDVSITAEGVGTLSIGGQTYTVNYWKTTDDEGYIRINDQATSSNSYNFFNSIETSKGAKMQFYQPTRVNLSAVNFGGSFGANVTSINIPDGDGYTNIAVAVQDHQNLTFGGTAVNNTGSVNATVGRLTYAFVGSGAGATVNTNVVDIFLLNPSTGARINEPTLVFLEEQDHNDNYEAMVLTQQGSSVAGDGFEVASVVRTKGISSYLTHETDTDVTSGATLWGSIVSLDNGPDQGTASISYPDEQVFAEVYIAEADAATVGGSGGGVISSFIVKDTEVSSVSTKNLIVVGGSCVNTVAASLLGSDVPLCTTAFTQETGVGTGSFLIETFDSPWASGQIATLVAGYNAGDTSNAATYLRTQPVDTMVGKKYIGTSGTSATLQTA